MKSEWNNGYDPIDELYLNEEARQKKKKKGYVMPSHSCTLDEINQ
jgi:hypothetical protein